MKFASAQWHQQIGQLISAVGCDDFADQLTGLIGSVVSFNQLVIICYQAEKAPIFWYSQVPQKRKVAVIDQYLNGCYLLDPWYHAYQQSLPTGLYFLESVAPDDFFTSEFYNEYYQAIEVNNEAVIAVDIRDDMQIQISMGITEAAVSKALMEELQIITPLVVQAAQKHWRDSLQESSELTDRATIIHQHVSHVFKTFGCDSLSERERDVAILMIRGYSLKAIADMLGVAFGTVKVHCKNLYKKLEINSQSELFALFVDAFSDPQLKASE